MLRKKRTAIKKSITRTLLSLSALILTQQTIAQTPPETEKSAVCYTDDLGIGTTVNFYADLEQPFNPTPPHNWTYMGTIPVEGFTGFENWLHPRTNSEYETLTGMLVAGGADTALVGTTGKPYIQLTDDTLEQTIHFNGTTSTKELPFTTPLRIIQNPFRHKMEVQYQPPQGSKTEVEIFDARGRHIDDLNNNNPTWDSRNQPSGIYFLKISEEQNGEKRVETRKVVKLK